MHTVKVDFPAEWDSVNIYPLADLHIGDPHSLSGLIGERFDMIQKDPHGLVILNGDLLNTALKNSVSDVYAEKLSPMEQISRLVDILSPIKDKIIGATTGNHENRVYRMDGVDIMRLVCRELGIEERYDPCGVLIFLRFGRKRSHKGGEMLQCYTVYASHGSGGGGRKEGAKAIRLADMSSIIDADVYVHSHTHLPITMKQAYFRVNPGNCSTAMVDRLFVNTGACLDYGGYGQAQEFKPASPAMPIITLSGTSKRMSASV
jgi:predicted phosphodiesterase